MDKQPKSIEEGIWSELDMDEFESSLMDADASAPMIFGTGHTVNACYHCDNSSQACSAGEVCKRIERSGIFRTAA